MKCLSCVVVTKSLHLAAARVVYPPVHRPSVGVRFFLSVMRSCRSPAPDHIINGGTFRGLMGQVMHVTALGVDSQLQSHRQTHPASKRSFMTLSSRNRFARAYLISEKKVFEVRSAWTENRALTETNRESRGVVHSANDERFRFDDEQKQTIHQLINCEHDQGPRVFRRDIREFIEKGSESRCPAAQR